VGFTPLWVCGMHLEPELLGYNGMQSCDPHIISPLWMLLSQVATRDFE